MRVAFTLAGALRFCHLPLCLPVERSAAVLWDGLVGWKLSRPLARDSTHSA